MTAQFSFASDYAWIPQTFGPRKEQWEHGVHHFADDRLGFFTLSSIAFDSPLCWLCSTRFLLPKVVYIGSATITWSSSPHTCMLSGCLRAIDARTQTEIWQIAPGETIDNSGLGGVVSSPVIAEGVVYLAGWMDIYMR